VNYSSGKSELESTEEHCCHSCDSIYEYCSERITCFSFCIAAVARVDAP